MDKVFPVLNIAFEPCHPPVTIPWSVVAPHEPQAILNHGHTLERLAERGGLTWVELLAVLTNSPYKAIHTDVARECVLLRVEQCGEAVNTVGVAFGQTEPFQVTWPTHCRFRNACSDYRECITSTCEHYATDITADIDYWGSGTGA